MQAPLQKWLHLLRARCRKKLLCQLAQLSPRWAGVENVDIEASTLAWRSMSEHHPLRGPLAALLTMSVATPSLLWKAKQIPTAACSSCGNDSCDLFHILWECPQWQKLREAWPYRKKDVEGYDQCVRSGLLVNRNIEGYDAALWQRLQLGGAQLIARWQEQQRAFRRGAPVTIASVNHTDQERAALVQQSDDHGTPQPLPQQRTLPQWGSMERSHPLWDLDYRIPDTKQWPYGKAWFFMIF